MFRIFRKPPSSAPREPPTISQTADKPQHKRKPTAFRYFVHIRKIKMSQFAPLQAGELQAAELPGLQACELQVCEFQRNHLRTYNRQEENLNG